MTETIQVVADIIQHELGLNPGQVMLAYEKFNIPTDGLFIVLSYAGPSKVIGSSDVWVDDAGIVVAAPFSPFTPGAVLPVPTGGLTEVKSVTILYTIQIDIMAFSKAGTNDARTRKEEVALALNSFYSEQAQEANYIQIGNNTGPFRDTSFLESTQFLQRYTTTINVAAALTKTKPADYYKDLSRAVPPFVAVNA